MKLLDRLEFGFTLLMMLTVPPTSVVESLNVAVLGSGVAGSTAARELADAGVTVTVFECGFGVGGRTSTRITRDECKFAFDHGAQYIGKPKTELFTNTLREWESQGFVKEWKGRFGEVLASSGGGDGDESSSSSSSLKIKHDAPGKPHFVGYPTMNSICKNLLDHENIQIVLQTRACAKWDDSRRKWDLTSHGERKPLGQFDWLVGGDRLSATNNRADLRDAPVDGFKALVEPIVSVPSLTLMVAFEAPLDNVPLDGILFEQKDDGEGKQFGALGWAARDTSKPGRERPDGRECWVVQSAPKIADEIISSTEGTSFENKREQVREKAKEILLADFLSAVQKLSNKPDSDAPNPEIATAIGHRWSAAFPVPHQEVDEFFTNKDCNFAACGDYMGKLTGRVEGAYLSGRAAAAAIIDANV